MFPLICVYTLYQPIIMLLQLTNKILDHFTDSLSACESESCQVIYLRAFKNLAHVNKNLQKVLKEFLEQPCKSCKAAIAAAQALRAKAGRNTSIFNKVRFLKWSFGLIAITNCIRHIEVTLDQNMINKTKCINIMMLTLPCILTHRA